jgi:hypothetical protein
MKKLISAILAVSMFMSATAYAECDFKTGITPTDHGTYEYTKECHVAVGQLRQNYLIDEQKIADLNKALDLKDLAITKANQRADLWMDTSFKLEDRVMTIDKMESTNKWIYFGLGVLTTFAAAYAARQAFGR